MLKKLNLTQNCHLINYKLHFWRWILWPGKRESNRFRKIKINIMWFYSHAKKWNNDKVVNENSVRKNPPGPLEYPPLKSMYMSYNIISYA